MGLLRRLFRSRKHQTPSSSPPLHEGETAGDSHPPPKAEEENTLKYTFPSPWPHQADPSHEAAMVPHHHRERPPAAAAAPQGSSTPCVSCGQEAYSLRYALHVSRMVLSVLCVVLGVAVMVLLAVTWVLTRMLAVLEGVGVGREEEEVEVLVGVDVGGGEVVVVMSEGEGGGGVGEVGGGDGEKMEVALGYEFVEAVRPVTGGEGKLAFAAARRAWRVCPVVVG